jgi:hypothetical protein
MPGPGEDNVHLWPRDGNGQAWVKGRKGYPSFVGAGTEGSRYTKEAFCDSERFAGDCLQFPHEPLRTFQSPPRDPVSSGGRISPILAWQRCRSPYFWPFAFLVSTS